jgi:hypothetical protein
MKYREEAAETAAETEFYAGIDGYWRDCHKQPTSIAVAIHDACDSKEENRNACFQ